ncbi:MAG TPA: thiol reductant ABC exporter subunit CydC [Actinocrinis sp.]|nr:thiol reductant ABC exporter subunit CydC [Actinocrinis sp.]
MRAIDPRLLRRARPVRGCLAALVFLGTLDAILLAVQATELANLVCAVVAGAPAAATTSTNTDAAIARDVHTLIPGVGRLLPHDPAQIGTAVLLLLAATGGRAAASWSRESIAARTSTMVKSALRADLLTGLVHGPTRAADRARTGDLAVLATLGVDALDGYFGRYLPQLTLAALVPLLLGVRILTVDPLSALIVALTLPLVPVFMALIGLLTRDHLAARWAALERLGGHFLEILGGLPTLVAFGRARRQTTIIRRAADAHRRLTMRTLRVAFLSSLALELIALVSVALVAVGIGLRLADGSLDLRTGLIVLICAPEVYLPLRHLGARYHEASEGLAAADRIFAETGGGAAIGAARSAASASAPVPADVAARRPGSLAGLGIVVGAPFRLGRSAVSSVHAKFSAIAGMDVPGVLADADQDIDTGDAETEAVHLPVQAHPRADAGTSTPDVPSARIDSDANAETDGAEDFAPDLAAAEIRFEHVDLARSGRSGPTLEDFCLRLAPGRITGLVGPSGAGKSTLIRLLLGFDRPTAGRVTVGGADLADPDDLARLGLDLDAWRGQVAWVPQHPQLTGRTVAAAIRLGDPGATDQDLARAAAAAGLDLPLDQPLGRRAGAVSGGQARRIALARAILRDAPVVLLDEPTEHLDPETEQIITEALRAWLPGRTVLLVTHRPALIDLCDSIVLLDHDSAHPNADPDAPARSTAPAQTRRRSAACATTTTSAAAARTSARLPAGFSAAWKNSLLGEQEPCDMDPGNAASETLAAATGSRRAAAPSAAGRLHLRVLGAIGLGSAAALCGIGLAAASAWLIATASLRPPLLTLQIGIAAVQAFGLGRAGLRYAERLAGHDATLRILGRLRVRVYRGLVRRAPAGLSAERGGDLLATVTADLEATRDLFLKVLLPMSGAAIACLAALLAEFLVLPGAALVLGAGIGIAGVLAPMAARQAARTSQQRTAAARAALAEHTVVLLDALPDLVAFGAAGAYAARVARADRRLSALERRGALGTGLGGALVVAAAGTTSAALALCVLDATWSGRLGGPVGAALVLAPIALFDLLALAPDAARALDRGRTARRRLDRVAGAPPLVPRPADPLPVRWTEDSELEFDRVGAAWPGARRAAVRDLSFRLPAGGQLTLSGPSGAGKSTAAHLATRGLDPFAGAVRLDGVDLRDADPDEVRALIAVADQNAHLFDATIRENLLIGGPDSSEEQLWAVLETVCLADWVDGLPDGLDTGVGQLGDAVSGGERQRIALARALLSPAPVLILDEPTAHLDAETAAALDENLRRVLQGRTVLWIRHDATVTPPIRLPGPGTGERADRAAAASARVPSNS